jgi:hypothetical protein
MHCPAVLAPPLGFKKGLHRSSRLGRGSDALHFEGKTVNRGVTTGESARCLGPTKLQQETSLRTWVSPDRSAGAISNSNDEVAQEFAFSVMSTHSEGRWALAL